MRYMGSKARFAKHILPIVLEGRTDAQTYVEPFAGGMNMIDKVTGKRIANDIHTGLIEMWKALVCDWQPPLTVTEEQYRQMKADKTGYPIELLAYVGFNSYGGKWFAGYCRDRGKQKDYWREHYNNIMKQVPNMKDVEFRNCSFTDLEIPPNSIIYCDPPYEGTTKYRTNFNHSLFWDWCREKSKQGHKVYISEYNAPDDFVCVWQKNAVSTLGANGETGDTKHSTERLFVLGGKNK